METLFPLADVVPAPAVASDVQWSFSKRGMLFQCPRKFYYHYYGSSSRTANFDPHKAQLRELKTITNLNLRAGDIVDLVIRTFLTRPDANATWNVQRLQNWALSMLEKDRDYNIGRNVPNGQFLPQKLLEFVRAFSDVDARFQTAKSKIFTALKHFAECESYAPFRVCGAHVKVQQNIAITVDGSSAKGKIDLAVSHENLHHILDWKIGAEGSSDENLQVGFYGLWASRQAAISTPVKLHMAYLADGVVKTYNVPAEVRPREVAARITQDLIVLRNLHPYGTAGIVKAFTPCLQPKICEMCQYEPVCSLKE